MQHQLSHEQIQQVLELGDAAKGLLDNPAFLSVIDHLSTYHLSALVAAPPGPAAHDAREHHHLQHYALIEIGQEIQARAAAAESLRAELSRIENEDDYS